MSTGNEEMRIKCERKTNKKADNQRTKSPEKAVKLLVSGSL